MSQDLLLNQVVKAREILLKQLNNLGFDTEEYENFKPEHVEIMLVNKQMDMLLHKKESNFRKHKRVLLATDDSKSDDNRETESVDSSDDDEPDGCVYVKFAVGEKDSKTKKREKISSIMIHKLARMYFDTDNVIQLRKQDTLIIVGENIDTATSDYTIFRAITAEWSNHGNHIIYRSLASLQFDILKHKSNPQQCWVCTKEEEEEFLAHFCDKTRELPEISYFDPLARCLLMRPGQIVCFNRKSVTVACSLFWRICKI